MFNILKSLKSKICISGSIPRFGHRVGCFCRLLSLNSWLSSDPLTLMVWISLIILTSSGNEGNFLVQMVSTQTKLELGCYLPIYHLKSSAHRDRPCCPTTLVTGNDRSETDVPQVPFPISLVPHQTPVTILSDSDQMQTKITYRCPLRCAVKKSGACPRYLIAVNVQSQICMKPALSAFSARKSRLLIGPLHLSLQTLI